MVRLKALDVLVTLLACFTIQIACQVLTPPNFKFNLAKNRKITATATCGEGVSEPELYCRLTGASSARARTSPDIIKGHRCDYCDPRRPDQFHPPEYAIDGTQRHWQSPPLSRSLDYNHVNLTIDLGQEFHVAYLFIRMANSPRPGVWALERSSDFGRTYSPWQYFADTPSDCLSFFNTRASTSSDVIQEDDSVLCTTEYSSVVPLTDGAIIIRLLHDRPSATRFTESESLQNWTKATNVRLRLIRTKTLLGHLMALAREDPTVTRRYYYAIKDISIGGRCVCNGHAETCDKTDPNDVSNHLLCNCQHNTCGDQCERCCPGFVQKQWQRASYNNGFECEPSHTEDNISNASDPNDVSNHLLCNCQHNTCGDQCERCCPGFVQKQWQRASYNNGFECEPCNCHGHSESCEYIQEVDDENDSLDIHGQYSGGGVCYDCRDNTAGTNCHLCKKFFYRPRGILPNDTHACQRCRCDSRISNGECEADTGRCVCKVAYAGEHCDRCSPGFYGYPKCVACDCDINGTEDGLCTVEGGICPCKPNFDGRNCDQCALGYYNFPECIACGCDVKGSTHITCDQYSGQCQCNSNYGDRDCSVCADGYFGYPTCDFCDCEPVGCKAQVCEKAAGLCLCQDNFSGRRCDRCAPNYFNYSTCQACECDRQGSTQQICATTGQCYCNQNFGGRTCNQCAPGFYNYPSCSPCNCDVYGSFGVTCDERTGQCNCRPHFEGPGCGKCQPDYYNYPMCEECKCNPAGAKEVDGYPLGGCGLVYHGHLCECKGTECKCNPAGAKEVDGYPLGGCGLVNHGQLCECKGTVQGRICDSCKPGFWNLNVNNPNGCQVCACSAKGSIGESDMCDKVNGQCPCKLTVGGKNCDQCRDGFYGLDPNDVYGCKYCACDVGGSATHRCAKDTGNCQCKPRVGGRSCDQPKKAHFYPTLHQEQYEMEEGRTHRGTPARYDFNTDAFPGYSWKGYVIMSDMQPKVEIDVIIKKPSLYRLLYRFMNPSDTVVAKIVVRPELAGEKEQKSAVVFEMTVDPSYATASVNNDPTTFVLNAGKYTIEIEADKSVFLDYLVLLPQAYYEPDVLKEQVTRPCYVPNDDGPCIHYAYPDLTTFPSITGSDGYVANGNVRIGTQLYDNADVVGEYNVTAIGLLDDKQKSIMLDLLVPNAGEYILLVEYYNTEKGRVQNLGVGVASRSWRADGKLALDYCTYSSLCRQVVKGNDRRPAVFNITSGYVVVTITGQDNVNVGIASVTAIPVNQWDLNLLQSSIKCIRINQKCLPATYKKPTGSVRIEFELGNGTSVSADLPKGYQGDPDQIIKLAPRARIDVPGMVRSLSQYIIVIHYIQPSAPTVAVAVTIAVGGRKIKGIFQPAFCASIAGCRGVVYFDSGKVIDLKDKQFTVSLNNSDGVPIWLDHFLLVPASQYSAADLEVLPIDKSIKFLEECVDENFVIRPNVNGFCKNSVFSLTTDNNNGALACACNIDGSLDLECEVIGGQCPCKPNVIGRTCTSCASNFYGFPDCQPCNCPYGLCQDDGTCICPPNVDGERCDQCKTETFGFDAIIGCEECNCNPEGVQGNDLTCDPITGECRCLANIGGRRCDVCDIGYHSLPRCELCDCDRNGTTEKVCNQISALCQCKSNTLAPRCDACRPETFALEANNPDGCTECFCFGTTVRCTSSDLRRHKISDMSEWQLTNVNGSDIEQYGEQLVVMVGDNVVDNTSALYWVAPQSYLGNRLTSYGGKLSYTIVFTFPRDGRPGNRALIRPDIILRGSNLTIAHSMTQQPQVNRAMDVEVELLEYNFEVLESGDSITREQFMMLLVNLEAIHIRGSFYMAMYQLRLSGVSLDIAIENGTGEVASNVESCTCPPNYVGTSCQDCARGYYRSKTGPYLGICVQCQCNGHADHCDQVTGECKDCQHNTEGVYCERCLKGHFGDATTSVCTMCSCPLPQASNNFADSCEVNAYLEVVKCDCHKGYAGALCNKCAPGYHGTPNVPFGECGACGCSNNIDRSDPGSCDAETGACLLCANNTSGDICGVCQEWFYGDAVGRKDCAQCTCNQCGSDYCDNYSGKCKCRENVVECTCNQCGSDYCDNYSGKCKCKENVVGDNCDQCAPDHYGYSYCRECEFCNCGVGSASSQCNDTTGACECKPGVKGRLCDTCKHGHWQYSRDGCEACTCMTDGAVTCDAVTGVCTCLPGVAGVNCDECHPRWVLIPEEGCTECDSCVNLLLDDLDRLAADLEASKTELNNLTVSILAFRRVRRLEESIIMLEDEMKAAGKAMAGVTLDPLRQRLQELKDQLDDLQTKIKQESDDTTALGSEITSLKTDADELDRSATQADREGRAAVDFVKQILNTIQGKIQVINMEELVNDAKAMLKDIEAVDFGGQNGTYRQELADAIEALEKARALRLQIDGLTNRSSLLFSNIKDNLERRLQHLQNESKDSEDKLHHVEDTLRIKYPIPGTFMVDLESVESGLLEIKGSRDRGEKLNNDTRDYLDSIKAAYKDIERDYTRLVGAMDKVKAHVDNLKRAVNSSDGMLQQAQDHADKLQTQAEKLQDMYVNTKKAADASLEAATAYKKIEEAIAAALQASQAADNDSLAAFTKSQGVGATSLKSKGKSDALSQKAQVTLNTTQIDLKAQLDGAVKATKEVEGVVDEASVKLGAVTANTEKLNKADLTAKAEKVKLRARDAEASSSDTLDNVKDILANLPEDQKKIEKIPLDLSNVRRDLTRTQAQVNRLNKLMPDTKNLLTEMDIRLDTVNSLLQHVRANLSELRAKIDAARGEAEKIHVGVGAQGDSALTLRPPESVYKHIEAHTTLSVFFQPNGSTDGLLVYLGSDQVDGRKDDYMALELKQGRVVLRYNLGKGPAEIINPKEIINLVWYKIEIERVGYLAKLIVITETGEIGGIKTEVQEEQTGSSVGTNSVLNLKPGEVKLIVMGVPPGFTVPTEVSKTGFQGNMEHLTFANVPVGLWNFAEETNPRSGAIQRNIMNKKSGEAATGYSFGGNAYLIMHRAGWNLNTKTRIFFKLVTYASNGLIVFMSDEGSNGDWLAISLVDGYINFKYDLGDRKPADITSTVRVNNGTDTYIVAFRNKDAGYIQVNELKRVVGFSGDDLPKTKRKTGLSIGDVWYIGGYSHDFLPKRAKVDNIPFIGCIDHLQIAPPREGINLVTSDYLKASVKAIPGCTTSVQRVISFVKDAPGYAAYQLNQENVLIEKEFTLTFKMRTRENSTMLVYTGASFEANEKDVDEFMVYVEKGHINMKIQAQGDHVILESNDAHYHDGAWHYISIMKKLEKLEMNIDDRDTVSQVYGMAADGITVELPLYFGGIANTIDRTLSPPLIGCIGDASVNGEFLDWNEFHPDNLVSVSKSPCEVSTDIKPVDGGKNMTDEVLDPSGKCTLSVQPDLSAESTVQKGQRFGLVPNSRLEFTSLPGKYAGKKSFITAAFSLSFRTTARHGVMFYLTKNHKDYISLYMVDGQVNMAFDAGSGSVYYNNPVRRNDGEWHTVRMVKDKKIAKLTIDRETPYTLMAKGSSFQTDFSTFFVGGFPSAEFEHVSGNIGKTGAIGFNGCLLDVMLDNVEFTNPSVDSGVQKCMDEEEHGVYFPQAPSSIVLSDAYSVGTDMTIELEIKPRVKSGPLVHVHSTAGDFLLLQLVEGDVMLSVDNGAGIISTRAQLMESNRICDGKWHSIKAVKAKNVVSLEVDGKAFKPEGGVIGQITTNTKHPLVLGALLENGEDKGIASNGTFVGCMRNIYIEDKLQYPMATQARGNVEFNRCPRK